MKIRVGHSLDMVIISRVCDVCLRWDKLVNFWQMTFFMALPLNTLNMPQML